MLNRRILRIKAFKVLFSYAENPTMTLPEAEALLEASCEATRSLYLFMLDIIPYLTAEARTRIENARKKFNPTEEERNPNLKFVRNSLSPLLEQDPDFQKIISRRKLSWEPYDAFVRSVYDSILTKEYFKEYMASAETSVEEDTRLFTRIFEEEFVDNEELDKILEDTLKAFAKGYRWSLPPLYRSEMMQDKGAAVESDKAFVYKLLRTAFACYGKYAPLVADSTSQWEKDRLFTTDMVLIVMGLSEAKAFPSLPVRVTINEYVEISKYYSTPKSRSFVNGLLDRLVKKQIEEGDIVKTEKIA